MQGLAVGRSVHYVAHGSPNGEYPAGAHRAATITEVVRHPEGSEQGAINLFVMSPTGLMFPQNVPYDPTGTLPGTWHWPERDEEN